VYLLAGQSNMGGRALIGNAPGSWKRPQADVLLYHGSDYAADSGWIRLRHGSANVPSPARLFGPELSFGRTLADGRPGERVALVKYARGGTSLAAHWDPDTGPYFRRFRETVTGAMRELHELGYAPEIRGLVWMQGEEDAGHAEQAAAYAENLSRLVDAVRTIAGDEDLPVVIGRINAPQRRFREPVRRAQDEAGAGPHAAVVSTDDLPLRDAAHYSAEGQLALGRRFATKILAIFDEKDRARR
jgi:hypothetical protein